MEPASPAARRRLFKGITTGRTDRNQAFGLHAVTGDGRLSVWVAVESS
jgi:hypothetical protein